MNVLVACEFSGVVRDAFIRAGHDAWSADLLPGQGEFSNRHIQGDVLSLLYGRTRRSVTDPRPVTWDLMIAHPPCTFLCNSGVRWLYHQGSTERFEPRWLDMERGAAFFRKLLNARVPRIAVENPVMHKYATALIGVDFTQSIQPWQFGTGETKRTCLWLKNLPPLVPTDVVSGREPRVHHMSPGADRGLLRSITDPNIAAAMAAQWGIL